MVIKKCIYIFRFLVYALIHQSKFLVFENLLGNKSDSVLYSMLHVLHCEVKAARGHLHRWLRFHIKQCAFILVLCSHLGGFKTF